MVHGLFNCNILLVFHSGRLELDGDEIYCEAIHCCCCCSFGSIYSYPFMLSNWLAANEAQACIPPRYKVRSLKQDDDLLTKIDGRGNTLCL